jgi:glycosyltransferase involved in cell wall biosynthesis
MKLLQILYSGLGGQGGVAFALVRADRERAHAHALAFCGVEPLAPGYAEACAARGAACHVVPKRRGLDLEAWRGLFGVLRTAAPDVVVLHSPSLLAAALAYRRAAGGRLVVVEHQANALKTRRDWAATVLSHATADAAVYLTPAYAGEVRRRLGPLWRPGRVHVVGTGLDVEAYAAAAAARAARPAGPLRVGMHGRFTSSKDHATLLRAVARVDGAVLRLAGDGATLPAARSLAAELGLGARVSFLGTLPEAALLDYLAGLDVFVQSSLGETLSTAVMQAMASGLPVVATDAPGLGTMVAAGATGLLVPPRDVAALAAALTRLRDDAALRDRLGSAAAAHARRAYGLDAMWRGYAAACRLAPLDAAVATGPAAGSLPRSPVSSRSSARAMSSQP